MTVSVVIDLQSITSVVGRIKTHKTQWGIIDRSGPLVEPVFADPVIAERAIVDSDDELLHY
jgi:hypothetical protein